MSLHSLTRVVLIQVNPAVLGGLVVDMGEKTIDLSVSSRVNKLNTLLQRTLSHARVCRQR